MNFFNQIKLIPKKSPDRKRVIILAGPLDNQSAGIHVYTRELINALEVENRRDIEYILIREKKSGDYPAFNTIVIPNISWLPGFASFKLFFFVPIICMILKADIVVEPAHFGPFNLPKWIKRITVIHDLTPILFPEYHTFMSSFLHKLFLKGILKKTDLIITDSENTKTDLHRIYPFTKQKVIRLYLGISPSFRPTKDSSVLKSYGITHPYFLFVGTIEPRKNLSLLLKAFEMYRKENQEKIKLVIIGKKGWKSDEFYRNLQQSSYCEDVVFPGFVLTEELPIFYSMARAFIYPSKYEGFGFPILEAMACGTKCIVAYNSSMIEIGGENVLFFETNDAMELRNQMNKLNVFMKTSEELISYANTFNWKDYSLAFNEIVKQNFKS